MAKLTHEKNKFNDIKVANQVNLTKIERSNQKGSAEAIPEVVTPVEKEESDGPIGFIAMPWKNNSLPVEGERDKKKKTKETTGFWEDKDKKKKKSRPKDTSKTPKSTDKTNQNALEKFLGQDMGTDNYDPL
uniref:Uncharacterized protein n=1 Tax=Heterorhabditis bacteriophora TaxID=37862 RepID=A0A1I7X6V9_HETBA